MVQRATAGPDSPGNGNLLVIVKKFPKLSETFILGELHALADRGYNIFILSLNRPDEDMMQPRAERFCSSICYCDRTLQWYLELFLSLSWMLLQPIASYRALHPNRDFGIRIILQGIWLARYCRLADIQHLHAHYFAATSEVAAVAAGISGNTFSISAHAKDIYLSDQARVQSLVERCDFVATCTQHNVDHLQRMTIEPQRVHRVYHGIDVDFFKPTLEKKQRIPLILAVGRYRKKKGFDLLIQACALLRQRQQSFQCAIVGYGEEKNDLAQLIRELDLEAQVSLVAPMNHDALKSYYERASVFAMPCRITEDGDRDGIPNVMLEAMSMGLPVVAAAVTGVPEVVENRSNGLLFPAERADALATGLCEILSCSETARHFSAAARRKILGQFTWEKNVESLIGLLEQVMLKNTGRHQP